MTKNILLGFIFCFLAINTQAQKIIDSLNIVYHAAKHDTTKIMALVDIAHEYRFDKPDTCIALATQALEMSEKIGFEKGKGWAINRIARAKIAKEDFAIAMDLLLKAQIHFEKANDKKGLWRNYDTWGYAYEVQNKPTLALEAYQKSLKIAEEISDKKNITNALNNIAYTYAGQGNYALTLEYRQKTLKLFEKIGRKSGISHVLRRIGGVYNKQGNYPLALEYMQKALKISEEMHNKIDIGNILRRIRDIYNAQNNASLALEYYPKSLQTAEESYLQSKVVTQRKGGGHLHL